MVVQIQRRVNDHPDVEELEKERREVCAQDGAVAGRRCEEFKEMEVRIVRIVEAFERLHDDEKHRNYHYCG